MFLIDGNPTKTLSTVDMLRVKGCDLQIFVLRANHHQTNHYIDTEQHEALTFYAH